MKKIKELANKYLDRIIELRRELHKYPELGFQEFKTAEIIKKELDRLRIPYESEIAKTGVIAYKRRTSRENSFIESRYGWVTLRRRE